MLDRILVSVIIPTFNRAQCIKRAILSIFNQKYTDLEIIVVNDGSKDNTSEIISSLQDRRLRLICHETNKGLAAARNTGINNAEGKFITFLDDDDEWLPEKINKQLNIFEEKQEEIGLVFTNGYSEAEKRSIINRTNSGIIYNPMVNKFFPLRILITPPSSWMLPAKIIKSIGYFDESMHSYWDDGDFFVRLANKHPVYFLNEDLVIWHLQEKHVNMISPNLIRGKEVFLQKNIEFLKKDKEYLFRFYRALGKDLLNLNKYRARQYLVKALRLNPLDFSTISKILRTYKS